MIVKTKTLGCVGVDNVYIQIRKQEWYMYINLEKIHVCACISGMDICNAEK